MKLRAWLWGGCWLALLVSVLGVVRLKSRQNAGPTMHGRPLSTWVADLEVDGDTYEGGPTTPKSRAEYAIRELGTNALPWLLNELAARNSPFVEFLQTHGGRSFGLSPGNATLDRRHWFACLGLQALGPIALPALVPLLDVLARPDLAYLLVPTVLSLGPQVTPALARMAANTNDLHFVPAAVVLLFSPGPRPPRLLAQLQSVQDNPNCVYRALAGQAARARTTEDALVIRRALETLRETNGPSHLVAIQTLADLGPAASSAIPALRRQREVAPPDELSALDKALRAIGDR